MNILTLLHALLFLLYWLTNLGYHADVNGFLANATGLGLPFVAIFMLVAALVGGWALARLVRKSQRGRWPFWIAGGIFVILFYGSFIYLFQQDPVQSARLGQLLDYFRLPLDAALLLAAAWFLPRLPVRPRWVAWAVWIGLAGLPLLVAPGNVVRGAVPDKPVLMAHRGASMLAPENTMASAEQAIAVGVYGLESDVLVSQDGRLFLMHDATLARTTSVAEVFPGRERAPGSDFTWEELGRLNAGAWFVEADPFGTIVSGLVSAAQAQAYRSEPVPSLADWAGLVARNDLAFVFDLREPPDGHPYRGQMLALALDELAAAGAGPKVWMLVGGADEIALVRARLPQAQLAAGIDGLNPPGADELTGAGYTVVNSEYSLPDTAIRAYRQAGLWVNLWTVDEPWQFSRLWLAGASSTTTNASHLLARLARPVFGMSWTVYLLVWGLLIASALVVFVRGRRAEAK